MLLSKDKILSLINNARVSLDGNNIYGNCPYCGGDEFGISLIKDNHLWGCFRKKQCGETGNIYKLCKKLGRMDILGKQIDVRKKLDIKIQDSPINENTGEFLKLPKNYPIGFKRLYNDEYLNNRGFNEQDYNYWKVGYTNLLDEYKGYIITLCEEEGECKGWIGRYKKPEAWIKNYNEKAKKEGIKTIPKYNNSHSVEFDKMVFNYDRISPRSHVILCEGVFDVFNVTRQLNLYNNKRLVACATYGAQISDYKIWKLKNKKVGKVILFFDFDMGKKFKHLAFKLVDVGIKTDIAIPIKGKDAGSMNREEIVSCLDNCKSPFFLDKHLIFSGLNY